MELLIQTYAQTHLHHHYPSQTFFNGREHHYIITERLNVHHMILPITRTCITDRAVKLLVHTIPQTQTSNTGCTER